MLRSSAVGLMEESGIEMVEEGDWLVRENSKFFMAQGVLPHPLSDAVEVPT